MSNIQISKEEYARLQDRDDKLRALENGGVDNWEWYDEAMSGYNEEKSKQERRLKLVAELTEYYSEVAQAEPHPGGSVQGYIATFPVIDEDAVLQIIDEYLKEED